MNSRTQHKMGFGSVSVFVLLFSSFYCFSKGETNNFGDVLSMSIEWRDKQLFVDVEREKESDWTAERKMLESIFFIFFWWANRVLIRLVWNDPLQWAAQMTFAMQSNDRPNPLAQFKANEWRKLNCEKSLHVTVVAVDAAHTPSLWNCDWVAEWLNELECELRSETNALWLTHDAHITSKWIFAKSRLMNDTGHMTTELGTEKKRFFLFFELRKRILFCLKASPSPYITRKIRYKTAWMVATNAGNRNDKIFENKTKWREQTKQNLEINNDHSTTSDGFSSTY